ICLHSVSRSRRTAMPKSSYPGLFDPAEEKLHALFGSDSFVIGRSETADLTVLDLSCSRQQFRIIRVEAQHYVEPLSRTSPTYHNGQPIGAPTLLAHEDRLQAGSCQFVFLAREPLAKGREAILAASLAGKSGGAA